MELFHRFVNEAVDVDASALLTMSVYDKAVFTVPS